MKNKVFRIISHYLIIIGIVSAFIVYLYQNAEKYQKLLNFSPKEILILFMIGLCFPIINGIQNTYLYRGLGVVDFSYLDGFLITSASTLANQLPIPGGILSRAYYLKSLHKLSYTKFASSTFAMFFCYLATSGLIGDSILIYWTLATGRSFPIILLIAFTSMLASLLVFLLPIDKMRVTDNIQYWLHQVVEGWNLIGKKPKLIMKLTIAQVLLVLLLSLRYLLVFKLLSQNISFSQTLIFASASILTQLVSIAPGGLGVREAIVASVATILGFDTGISVVAISLDRLVVTIVIVVTGWISAQILGKKITSSTSSELC